MPMLLTIAASPPSAMAPPQSQFRLRGGGGGGDLGIGEHRRSVSLEATASPSSWRTSTLPSPSSWASWPLASGVSPAPQWTSHNFNNITYFSHSPIHPHLSSFLSSIFKQPISRSFVRELADTDFASVQNCVKLGLYLKK